ncbi:MAG: glycerophosphodiester phosphodiesterase family protein, partial [Myxococcota bacterium]|nr:glycerophosphodiester phosphodiesterase family protein [Myxococcota bacterium]
MRVVLTALALALLLEVPAAAVSLDLAGSQLGQNRVDDLSGPGAIRIDPDLRGAQPAVFRFVLDDEDTGDVLTLNAAVDLLGGPPWVGFELTLGPGVSFLSVGDTTPLVADSFFLAAVTPDSVGIFFVPASEPAGFDLGDPFGLGLSDWRIDRSGLAAGEAFTVTLKGRVPEPQPAFLLGLGVAALLLARARRRRLLLTPLLALSLSCTPEPFAVQPALADLTSPVVVGHRGALDLCPQNTLPCYELALQLGAAALEADLQVLGDGTLVMLHDENTDSVSGVDLEIADIDLATLQALDAGFEFTPDGGRTHPYRDQGLRVLTLAEFLEALPDVPVLLDVKPETPEM